MIIFDYVLDLYNILKQKTNDISLLAALFTIIVPLMSFFSKVKIIEKKINHNKELDFVLDKDIKKMLKNYISTRGQDIDPCNNDEIIENRQCKTIRLVPFILARNFEKNRNKYYLILGDSGMGKTTFLYKVYITYKRKINRTHDIYYIPLSYDDEMEIINTIDNNLTVESLYH